MRAITRAVTKRMAFGLALLAAQPGVSAVMAQAPCQPLQGTAAHATCLNQQLSRATDPDLRALEDQARGQIAPEMNLNQRRAAPSPAYRSDFGADQAARTQRLEQSTQSRAQSLSGRINRALRPQARGF